MFTQITSYFKFSEVKIKSYLFTHLTYKVKTGPPRVGATGTAMPETRQKGEDSKLSRALGIILSLVSTSQKLLGEKWVLWNNASLGSRSILKITVSEIIYTAILHQGKHSPASGSGRDLLLLCLDIRQLRRIRGVARELGFL